ncbi:hypothetical protein [uncultured Chitinophaga sp.]|jgi:hypothetical protein|uniref:hypothetical protein n=1 Tax=uncultured Chitinophaga sp. TaxID=339340 RepID=UPI00260A9EEE|nr:hypothetical protein [uncultured Chitinophaga sp.]
MSNDNPVSQPVQAPFPPLFKRQVLKASGFILLFFTAYILLLILTTALAAACMAGGVFLLMSLRQVLPVILALGLVLLGLMLLFLLGGSLFSRRQGTRQLRTLLQPAEHPRLFHSISEISAATRTRFRGKVFAVPGARAAVFHGPGNLRLTGSQLEIGLGLVNSLNVGELKMILARTLTRFSVPGMQLGNYVSGLHQWIYQRLYENERLHMTIIQRLGRSYLLRPFSQTTMGIANGIQYLLQGLFALVNRAYIPVSREMEFYADAVGTLVSGSHTAVSALHRAEIGGHCLERCLDELPGLNARGLRFRNLYEAQGALIRRYAAHNYLRTDAAGLPLITDTYLQTFVKSRVQFRRQAASQPGLDERTHRIKIIRAADTAEKASAWDLFNERLRLQEEMTARQYGATTLPENQQWYGVTDFMAALQQAEQQYAAPAAFSGYYDNRLFTPLTADWKQPLTEAEKALYTFDALYDPANSIRIRSYFRDRLDLETLEAIAERQIPLSHFEFDGQTYPAAQAAPLIMELSAALTREEAWLQAHDCLAFRYHYTRALQKGTAPAQQLLQLYEQVILHQEMAEQLGAIVADAVDRHTMFTDADLPSTEYLAAMDDILQADYHRFRGLIEILCQYQEVVNHWDEELREKVKELIQERSMLTVEDVGPQVLQQYDNYVALTRKAYLDLVLEFSPQTIVQEY